MFELMDFIRCRLRGEWLSIFAEVHRGQPEGSRAKTNPSVKVSFAACIESSLLSFQNMDSLETPRLLLRPVELADAAQVQRIFPHWEVVRYLVGVPWPYPADGALTYYRDVALPAMDREEEWHWTLRLKSVPEKVIGQVSLMRRENNNRGFWLGLPWRRKGYMREAVEVATDYGFNTLGFPLIRAPKAVTNVASRRISEKSGMRIVAMEEREYVAGKFMAEIWEITAEEWRLRRSKLPGPR